MTNALYYGDNLGVLRASIPDESVDLIYLDPPFNSNASYNVLFKAPSGEGSQAQIEAFEDTWHWNESAERAFDEVVTGPHSDAAIMLKAMRSALGERGGPGCLNRFSAPLSGASAGVRPQPSKAALEKLKTLGVMKTREDLPAFLARAFRNSPPTAMLRKTRTERTNAKTDLAAVEAWCGAVLVKADAQMLPQVKKKARGLEVARNLARLSVQPNGPVLAREALARIGVLLVTLDHLPGTFLDGAAISRGDGVPVIALTLRYDRIDNFWFTLLHEFAHVSCHLNNKTTMILDDLEVKGTNEIEREADAFAQDALIPLALWKRASSPGLTPEDVVQIAADAQVHPAVVAGRWQRDHGDYRRFSKMLGRGEVRALLK